jgi:hypothetical protein
VLDDFVWKVLSIVLNGLIIKSSTDQSLGGNDGVFGIGNSLSLGSRANKSFTFFSKGDD